jgi:glycosyltransferase involved in cell wall biosynthesis
VEKSYYELQIKGYGLKDNVIIEGWTNDLSSYYKTADMFIITSNYEGYGMTAVEAMAGGCPVIMTDVGLAGEVLIDSENGLVTPVGDKKALVEALNKLINNEDLRSKLSQNALEAVSHLQTKQQYLEAYKKDWEGCVK